MEGGLVKAYSVGAIDNQFTIRDASQSKSQLTRFSFASAQQRFTRLLAIRSQSLEPTLLIDRRNTRPSDLSFLTRWLSLRNLRDTHSLPLAFIPRPAESFRLRSVLPREVLRYP